MNNFMSRAFSPDEVIGLFALVCLTAAGIVAILAAILTAHKRSVMRDEMEATLKMEMIERGMSADEIERVLAAKMGPPAKTPSCNHRTSGNRAAPVP
jgi:hypothetical protein